MSMKIKDCRLLLGLTALFAVFLLGFFLGRHRIGPVITTGRTPPSGYALSTETVHAEPVFPIDINSASAYELSFLPGIGQVIAGRIVDYRVEHGAFSEFAELLNVDGIGPSRLEELLPYITLGG